MAHLPTYFNMKKIPCILSFWMLWAISSFLSAQTDGSYQSILDALQQSAPGKGEVNIHQSPAIRNLIGTRVYGSDVEKNGEDTFLKTQGFRMQVFSGNNQRKSKDEAFRKEKEIKELFPDLPTYVTYNAPFWKLRVGDFRTHEEAYHIQRLLMEAFPAYKKEMYIVKEEVRIPLY